MKFITHFKNYPEERNILNLHGDSCQFKALNTTRVTRKATSLMGIQNHFLNQLYFHSNNTSVLHTFNGINALWGSFIVSFESDIPRMWMTMKRWQLRYCLKALASERCLLLIAISERSNLLHKQRLAEFRSMGVIDDVSVKRILKKTITIHPTQQLIEPSFIPRTGPLRIIFVGNLFFLKGGRELFLACERLVRAGINLELTIISTIEPDHWCSKTDEFDATSWRQKLGTTEWTQIETNLPNHKVLTLIRLHHIAAFPTKRDSYGYFTLESQACGVPVISSDYGVLPEINKTGWIVSKGSVSDDQIDQKLIKGISQSIMEALDDKVRRQKSLDSWNRIQEHHNAVILKEELHQRLDEVSRIHC